MKTELALFVHFDASQGGGGYTHLTARIVRPDSKAVNGFDSVEYGSEFEGIALHAQMDRESDKAYAFDVHYDTYNRVTAARAKQAASILGKIESKLEKMTDNEGYAQSLGQWVNRVCRALNIKTIIFRRIDPRASSSAFQTLSIGDAVYTIDRSAQSFCKQIETSQA